MIIKSLKKGFSQLWQYKKIWVLLYSLTFVVAAFIAYPLKTYLENKIGTSLMIKDMIKGFDYTLYTDFMNHYGDGIAPIMNYSLLLIILFMLLFIFLMGGILSTFKNAPEKYNGKSFWSNAAHFFWRIFRMTIYFLFIHGAVLGLFFFIYLKITKGLSPMNLESEGIIFVAMKIMVPIYILFSSFFFMWHDYAKIHLVQNDNKWIFQSIIPSLKFIIKNIKNTWGLYLLNVLILMLLFIVNHFISNSFEITTGLSIFISFFISQLFLISRLGLKLVNLSSANHLFQENN